MLTKLFPAYGRHYTGLYYMTDSYRRELKYSSKTNSLVPFGNSNTKPWDKFYFYAGVHVTFGCNPSVDGWKSSPLYLLVANQYLEYHHENDR